MRRAAIPAAVLTISLASGALAVPSASAAQKPSGSLSDITALGLSGASPHADQRPDGSVLLYYPSMEAGGTAVASCSMAGACTVVGSIPRIADLTDVVLADGTRRAYYVDLDTQTKFKSIYTATMAADGLSIGAPAAVGISSEGAMAWGVPDAVTLPDGRVRLYWVEPSPQGGMATEVVVSATSTDASGTAFVRDAGYRTTGGVVDFEVLRAEDGNWLAITSTSPEDPNNPQRLFLASSDDGLTWNVNRTSISPLAMSYLDPTGFATGPNTFRIYYAKAPNALGDREYTLEQATLTVGTSDATSDTKKKKKKKKKKKNKKR